MKKRYSTIGGDDTPFNSSLAYLERLERRWEDADDCKIEGTMISYYRTLHTIYMNTHPFFEKEENDKVLELIKKCEQSVKTADISHDMRAVSLIITEIEKNLDELRMLLVQLLFKYKITYHRREEITWEKEIEDDFK